MQTSKAAHKVTPAPTVKPSSCPVTPDPPTGSHGTLTGAMVATGQEKASQEFDFRHPLEQGNESLFCGL